jgi:hypothetical protein
MKQNSPTTCGVFFLDHFAHPAKKESHCLRGYALSSLCSFKYLCAHPAAVAMAALAGRHQLLRSAISLVSFAMISQLAQLLARKRIIRLIGLEKCRSCLVRSHVFAPS